MGIRVSLNFPIITYLIPYCVVLFSYLISFNVTGLISSRADEIADARRDPRIQRVSIPSDFVYPSNP